MHPSVPPPPSLPPPPSFSLSGFLISMCLHSQLQSLIINTQEGGSSRLWEKGTELFYEATQPDSQTASLPACLSHLPTIITLYKLALKTSVLSIVPYCTSSLGFSPSTYTEPRSLRIPCVYRAYPCIAAHRPWQGVETVIVPLRSMDYPLPT